MAGLVRLETREPSGAVVRARGARRGGVRSEVVPVSGGLPLSVCVGKKQSDSESDTDRTVTDPGCQRVGSHRTVRFRREVNRHRDAE